MSDKLKVLICGTGYAGQGHAQAFGEESVDVVGMYGRTESVLNEVAAKLDIPYTSTNWEQALRDCQPDIVAIGTPGGAHIEPITQAIEHGCHVFCDKPLTQDGDSARKLYELAVAKGVKTAFAASYRYTPGILHAKQLVADGAIGEPLEMECISHFNLERHIPFGWSHTKAAGGGRLNNNFTHLISIATHIIGEEILAISGEVRNDLGKAPIVEGVPNFKTRRELIPKTSTTRTSNGANPTWNGRTPCSRSWRAGILRDNQCPSCFATADCSLDSTRIISSSTAAKALSTSRDTTAVGLSTCMPKAKAGRNSRCRTRLRHRCPISRTIPNATGPISFASF